MKKLSIVLLALVMSGCSTGKILMKNCTGVGAIKGESYFECDDVPFKSAKDVQSHK